MNVMLFTIPNFITFLRLPLALAFLQANPTWRAVALILAMASDGLDGYIARSYNQKSRFGTFFDPFTDKVFVIVALSVLITENKLDLWEAASILCRDFSVLIFGLYLSAKGMIFEYQFRSIWCGKLTTALQFFVLVALTLGFSISPALYCVFILLGAAALVELYLSRTKLKLE